MVLVLVRGTERILLSMEERNDLEGVYGSKSSER